MENSSFGYSKKPLYQKLGIKDSTNLKILDMPSELTTLISTPFPLKFSETEVDALLYFVRKVSDLEKNIQSLRGKIKENGAIWVIWPKKTSKIETDLNENKIRDVVLPIGLVDIKVCSVHEDWSGLKVVLRREIRKKV